MRSQEAADRIGVSSASVRIWTAAPTAKKPAGPFYEFMSDKGKGGRGQRDLSDQDVRILYQAHLLSTAGSTIDEIRAALKDMEAARWAGLPDLPPSPEEVKALTVPIAEVRATLEKQRADYSAQLATVTQERDHLATMLELTTTDRDQLRTELQDSTKEEARLRGKLENIDAQIDELRGQRRLWLRAALVLGIVALVAVVILVAVLALQAGAG